MKKHLKGRPVFQLIDRNKFNALVKKWSMDKWVQSFSTWEMTQALICCFVMRIESFREVEATLKIPDSTFGDALRERSYGFFQELCDLILLEIRAKTESRKIKKAIRQILAIDSTEIKYMGVYLFNQGGNKSIAILLIKPPQNFMSYGTSMENGLMILLSRQEDETIPLSALICAYCREKLTCSTGPTMILIFGRKL